MAEGGFAVEVNGRVLAHRGPCELVGEMALLQNAPRNATVRAVQESRVYRLERSEFLAAITGHPVSSRQASDLVAARLGQLRRNVLDER